MPARAIPSSKTRTINFEYSIINAQSEKAVENMSVMNVMYSFALSRTRV